MTEHPAEKDAGPASDQAALERVSVLRSWVHLLREGRSEHHLTVCGLEVNVERVTLPRTDNWDSWLVTCPTCRERGACVIPPEVGDHD